MWSKKICKIFYSGNSKGFSLLEAVISISILMFGITGTYLTLVSTINNTTDASSKMIGSYLAQEGVEIVRNFRDENWMNPPNDWFYQIGSSCLSTSGGCEMDYTTGTSGGYPVQGWTGTGTPLNLDSNGWYNYLSTGNATMFTRKIEVTAIDPDAVYLVTSTVYWRSSKGGVLSFSVKDYLYNWN